MVNKLAQDLKCGDVFLFRNITYLTLSSVTEIRTTHTLITCSTDKDDPTTIRFFRTFPVSVTETITMSLEVLHNTRDEITPEMESELFTIRKVEETFC